MKENCSLRAHPFLIYHLIYYHGQPWKKKKSRINAYTVNSKRYVYIISVYMFKSAMIHYYSWMVAGSNIWFNVWKSLTIAILCKSLNTYLQNSVRSLHESRILYVQWLYQGSRLLGRTVSSIIIQHLLWTKN